MVKKKSHSFKEISDAELKKLYADHDNYILKSFIPWPPRIKEPFIVSGEGAYFYDAEGKRYLDFVSQLFNINVGFKNMEIINAIHEQFEQIAYVSTHNPSLPRTRLAKKLAEITEGRFWKFYFTNSGAEANETAIKIARQYTGRLKIIGLWKAYHGSTYATASAGGQAYLRTSSEPLPAGFCHIPPPYCYRCFFELEYPSCNLRCASFLEDTVKWEDPATVAGFIGEPIPSGSGQLVPPDDYWPMIRRICDKYDMVLINDEVMTGFGRTGKMFGHQHWNYFPDIIDVAKGITSGYIPLGATMISKRIGDFFTYPPYFQHSYTYSGHPVACAASLATIDVYLKRKVPENAAKVGNYLIKSLRDMQERHRSIGDVRGKGLFIGIEFVKDKDTKEPLIPKDAKAPPEEVPLQLLQLKCGEKGLWILRAMGTDPIIRLAPPLIITEQDVDKAMTIFEEGVTDIEKKFM